MDPLPYPNRLVSDLRKECRNRKIVVSAKSCKADIVKLLTEDDLAKEKAAPPPDVINLTEDNPINEKPVFQLRNGRIEAIIQQTDALKQQTAILKGLINGHSAPPQENSINVPTPIEKDPSDLWTPASESSDSEGEPETLLEFKTLEVTLPTAKSAKKAPRLAITLEGLTKEIKDGDFINSFLSSVQAFLQYKTKFYAKKLKENEQDYARLSAKVKKLKAAGVDHRAIRDSFPMYPFYSCFIAQLKDVINIVSKRAKTLTPATLKTNLLRAINHTKKGFASIVGRDDIKNHLAAVLYSFSKSHKSLIGSFNNICLMGNAGVGKTAIAKVIGYVFSKSGLLATNSVKIVSRSDLVKGWVGQTAPNVRAILFESLEGVLFIDEAYGLTPLDPGNDTGPEAMTEIVNFLDKYIGMNVTIVAGYTRLMKMTFFPSNEGLARRFPIVMELKDYSNRELVNILVRFINSKRDQKLDSKTCNYLYSLVISLKKEYPMIFKGQAGDMLNLGTAIVKSINASFRKPWKEGRLENNKEIIMEAVREYADLKEIKWNDSEEESDDLEEEVDDEESEDLEEES